MGSQGQIGQREHEILTAIVESYIATGEPVGSRVLARVSSEGLSPASIRNVMSDLVDNGFLEQPHTSAGRIPTPAAYQYYVYKDRDDSPPLKGWMRAPTIDEINTLQRDGDKTWDLGWVYTVIAGVLNVLVIYDALAGPAFREAKAPQPAGAA